MGLLCSSDYAQRKILFFFFHTRMTSQGPSLACTPAKAPPCPQRHLHAQVPPRWRLCGVRLATGRRVHGQHGAARARRSRTTGLFLAAGDARPSSST